MFERTSGKLRRSFYGRRREEYLADFYLIAKRTLNEADFDILKFHFLYGADWKLCCRRFQMDRGTFFHAVYRIQQTLGRTFRDLEPYPLYPLEDYFNNAGRLNLADLRSTNGGKGRHCRAAARRPALEREGRVNVGDVSAEEGGAGTPPLPSSDVNRKPPGRAVTSDPYSPSPWMLMIETRLGA
jgi:hypothetical protein